MSTFSGLVLGIVTAAAVTVMYGDALNSKLRDFAAQLRAVDIVSAVEQTTSRLPAREAVQLDLPLPEKVEAVTAPVIVGDSSLAVPDAGITLARESGESTAPAAADSLQQRWAQYRENAGKLPPSASFPHQACFTRAAAVHGVPTSLLLAVARGESNFDSAARSSKDAIGLMQIRWPVTSRHLGVMRQADLYDPCTNVEAGARYLAELSERYDQDLHRVLGAYNYGPGRIDSGPMPEGARWYSQYIYQHLQHVLGQSHVASSELLAGPPVGEGGHQVLMTFNQPYRAREFMQFLAQLAPGVELAQRSETLGRHEVVLLYDNTGERERGLQTIQGTGLVALNTDTTAVKSL